MHRRHRARIVALRARVLFLGFLIVAVFLAWRLFDIQILQGPALAKGAYEQDSDVVDVFARRGEILDRNGRVLVRSLPSESIYAVPHDLANPAAAIRALTPIVGPIDPTLAAELHDRHLWFVWVARKVPHEWAARVRALDMPGLDVKREETGRRVDVAGTMLSTVLGFVGTDDNGLSGLEYSMNDVLRGRSGKTELETDEFGRPIPFGRQKVIRPARPGHDVELTIDSYLQYVTEQALAQAVRTYHASSGSAIVMDPATGAVLALANIPDYDPNRFWRYPESDRRDRAVMDAYEPGSTFKLVTAAAALLSGKVTPRTQFPARDELTVGGRTIHNAVDGLAIRGPTETLEQIIADSLNVGAAEVALRIGPRAFYDFARKAGFGSPTDIELPGESAGILPPPNEWSGSTLATMAFGQGIAVTPLQLARYYCAIANGGLLLRPRIVQAVLDQDGHVVERSHTTVIRRIFPASVAAQLLAYLRAVVEYGTGNPSARVPGYSSAGKTGTAQIAENGIYQPGAYIASFVGMVPAHHPRFVILVKVDHPQGSYYGAQVAAPVFVAIARAALLHAGVLPQVQRRS
jgi:stage V sporulation protein D (sporulation-specific penicillin-binding protein)